MKPDDIQKIVLSNPRASEPADAPNTRRFEKIPGARHPKGKRRKKLKSESRKAKRLLRKRNRIMKIRTFLLLGAAILVIGFFLAKWLIPRATQQVPDVASLGDIPPVAGIKTKVVSQFPSPNSEDALAIVKQALAIRDPPKVAEFFRPGDASPQEIVEFLQGMDASEGPLDSMRWLSTIYTTTVPIEGVSVKFKGKERPGSRLVLLTPDLSGKWQIDFEAFARKVTPSWTDLLEKQAPFGLVRVYIAKDVYYNGPFIDEKKWVCYSIASPELEETLRAYCKIDSPQAAAIASLLSKEARFARVTLEIKRVVGADSRQFEISKVLAEDWVLGPSPFEDGFK